MSSFKVSSIAPMLHHQCQKIFYYENIFGNAHSIISLHSDHRIIVTGLGRYGQIAIDKYSNHLFGSRRYHAARYQVGHFFDDISKSYFIFKKKTTGKHSVGAVSAKSFNTFFFSKKFKKQ